MHLTLDLLLVIAVLALLALQWRKTVIVTEYRDRVVPADPPVLVPERSQAPSPALARMPTPAPEPARVRVRFLDEYGQVCGETNLAAKARRPILTHAGTRYVAEQCAPDGVWNYRRTQH